MRYSIARRACPLAVLGIVALAGTAPAGDDANPRAPDQALDVKLAPWFCATCLKRGLITGEPRQIVFLGRPAAQLARDLKIRGSWQAIESPNFRIFSTLKGARIKAAESRFAGYDLMRLKRIFPEYKGGMDGGYVNAHERAHLFQVRFERLYAHFAALTRNRKPHLGMDQRFQILLFEKPATYHAVVKLAGGELKRGQTLFSSHLVGPGNHMLCTTAAGFFKGGDAQLDNTMCHIVGEMLVMCHNNYYTDVWAWLREGFAHYFERRESEKYNHFCTDQVAPPEFVKGNWRRKIRHMVYLRQDPSLGGFCEKRSPYQLTGTEHAISWSIVDWLVRTDPIRMSKLLDLSSDGRQVHSAADAIEEVFGITPYVLDERWRKYVLKAYK